jgi:orotate phosphoribosyltransferase-like protein
MPDAPLSIEGQILALRDRGFAPKEIATELRVKRDRVQAVLRKAQSRTLDSRRIAEIYELALENNAMLKELLTAHRYKLADKRLRVIERSLPGKVGDRLTTECGEPRDPV